MPWKSGSLYASEHDKKLKGSAADKAAEVATAALKSGAPEGEAIAIGDKAGDKKERSLNKSKDCKMRIDEIPICPELATWVSSYRKDPTAREMIIDIGDEYVSLNLGLVQMCYDSGGPGHALRFIISEVKAAYEVVDAK